VLHHQDEIDSEMKIQSMNQFRQRQVMYKQELDRQREDRLSEKYRDKAMAMHMDKNILDYQQKQADSRFQREVMKTDQLKQDMLRKAQTSMADKVLFEH